MLYSIELVSARHQHEAAIVLLKNGKADFTQGAVTVDVVTTAGTTAMGSCSRIEIGLHSEYKDKWEFVGKEQNGSLWMKNCSEETSGGRRNSG